MENPAGVLATIWARASTPAGFYTPQYYSATQPHAITSRTGGGTTGSFFQYDANGNMTLRVEVSGSQRITSTQGWDVENRLVAVTNTVNGQVTQFWYDADGQRLKRVDSSGTVVYITRQFERLNVGGVVTRTAYYGFGGQRVAMRVYSTWPGNVYYLHGDHLGSASLTTDGAGNPLAQMRYYPFGETRWVSGTLPTDRRFTGQLELAGLGIYDYGSRAYSPLLGRFLSADTVIQAPYDPQALNRYSYVRNNPIQYVDPTGHCFVPPVAVLCVIGGFLLIGGAATYETYYAPGAAQRQAQATQALTAFFDVVAEDGQNVWSAVSSAVSSALPTPSLGGAASGFPMPPHDPRDPEHKDWQRLGDRSKESGGRFSETQADTGWRLQKFLGKKLEIFDAQKFPTKAGDFYDPSNGQTYEAFTARINSSTDMKLFYEQLETHIGTANNLFKGANRLVIDLAEITDRTMSHAIQDRIMGYLMKNGLGYLLDNGSITILYP